MIVRKDLPIRDFLNHAILKLSERGELDAIRKKWEVAQPDCNSSQRSNEKPLSMKKLSLLFIIVLVGFAIALITFLMEKLKCYFGQHASAQ